MSRIKGKNTTPEMLVRKFLYSHGFRYRLHVSNLPGKPDIVIGSCKTIVDIRGCFWHGHRSCKFGDNVKTESSIIKERVEDAILRDLKNIKQWKKLGWHVFILWDSCQLQSRKKVSPKRLRLLQSLIRKLDKLRDTNS